MSDEIIVVVLPWLVRLAILAWFIGGALYATSCNYPYKTMWILPIFIYRLLFGVPIAFSHSLKERARR